jgi:IS30 family transposase
MCELRNDIRDHTDQALRAPSSEQEYLTVVETAMRARLSPKTLYNWINMGKITGSQGVHHAGRKVVIHWATFEASVMR